METHVDRIEIFLGDETNPIVVLPIAFAKALAADLCLHTPGADALEEAPVMGLLNLQTVNHPNPGLNIFPLNEEPTVYQCPVELASNDVFTALSIIVSCDGTMNDTAINVFID